MQSHVLAGDLTQPIFLVNDHVFVHHRNGDIHLFATTSKNGDAMAAVYFLHELIKVLDCFMKNNLNTEKLHKN